MLKPLQIIEEKYVNPNNPPSQKTTFYWCPRCRRPYEQFFDNSSHKTIVEYYDLGGVAGNRDKVCPACRMKEARGIWEELQDV